MRIDFGSQQVRYRAPLPHTADPRQQIPGGIDVAVVPGGFRSQ